jgi:hypothetical protein
MLIASQTWVNDFKDTYRIRRRKFTRYTTSKDSATLEETLNSTQRFQKFVALEIPKFDLHVVINIDRTGCEYKVNVKRTLTHIGQKVVEVNTENLNTVTHSYTA